MVEPTSTLRPDRASTAASSSSSPPPPDVDLPEKLDQCVKETLLLGFSTAVMHSAVRDLTTIREAVLGVDRVKGLIAQGYSPEMIGSMIASKQELLDGFKSVKGGVRDLALGYTVVQVATQFDSVSGVTLQHPATAIDSIDLTSLPGNAE